MPERAAVTYDVAIVGYGPVGATFANLLAGYGLSVAVVEQAAGIYDKPRAITIDHEVLRVWQACGLTEALEKGIAPHPGTHYLGVDGALIKIFDPMPPPYPLSWVPTATFVQPEIERALRERLAQHVGADLFMPARAVAFEQDEDGVSLEIETAGATRVLRARYLVACDGAASFVRKRLDDVVLDDLAFDEWWIVVDALAGDMSKRPNKCFQYCRPSRPGTYLPGPGALRRWEIKILLGERPDDFASEDGILEVLRDFTDTSDLKIWRSAVYRFHALLARRWRVRRIFLMGDAVHQTPPFLGQGLSAGVRDAFNLAWKLAFVLTGNAGDALLDTYEVERKPHVGAVVATAKEFGEIIGELDPAAAQARDHRLREELRSGKAETIRQKFIPDLAAGLIAPGAKLAGSLFVQPRIRCADDRLVRLDDLLPLGFAMVAASAEPLNWLTPQSLQSWGELGGALVVVVGNGMWIDASDGVIKVTEEGRLFRDWLQINQTAVVIVRPDRYVFGAADHAHELNELVGKIVAGVAAPENGSERCPLRRMPAS